MRVMKVASETLLGRGPKAMVALTVSALLAAGHAGLSLAAGTANQVSFSSPEEASEDLFLAVKNDDQRAVKQVLGGGSELVDSDDKVQDRLDREQFAQKYQQMHRLAREGTDIKRLYVGAENWPFPVPLVSQNGKWHFDSEAGVREVQYRRIGENEITAIEQGRSLIKAEDSAQAADAKNAVKVENATEPLHGYYFRIMPDSHNHLAIVAYPAKYRASGVMTFIVYQDGQVREKDLGPDTAKIAQAVVVQDAQSSWNAVDGQ
jgi:hypothetical protein